MASQLNGTHQIQAINHLSTTYPLPSAGAGQFTYPLNAGASCLAIANASGVNIATPIALSTYNASVFDPSGNGNNYHVVNDPTGNKFVIYGFSIAGAALWASTTIAPTGGHDGSAHITFAGGYIYVSVTNETDVVGTQSCSVYRVDPTTGIATLWYTNATAFGVTDQQSFFICNLLAANGTVLALGGQQNNATDEVMDLISLATTTRLATVRFGPDSTQTITDICTDGTNFYITLKTTDGTPNLYKVSPAGTVLWSTVITQVTWSCCFDPVGNRVVVSLGDGAGNNSVKTYNPATGANVATASTVVGQSGVGAVIRTDNNGKFVTWAKAGSNNAMGLKADLTAQWGPLTLGAQPTFAWAQGLAVNPIGSSGVGAATLSSVNTRILGVSNGTISRFTSSGPVALSGGAALALGVPVVASAALFQKMYFSDGSTYQVYDALTDAVTALVASAGSLPTDSFGNTGRLMCAWRECLVVSGLPRDGNNWFMSKKTDPTNWAYNASPATEDMAVAGNNGPAGVSGAPDIITALVPYSDEILIFGQDHSLSQMTGHPAAGGRIDLVSDQVGMAFGNSWCRDGSGVLYFLSSRGSFYRFVPGGIPERLSDPINQLLAGIDYSNSVITLAWDEREQSVRIYVTPPGQAASINFIYDVRNGGWWIDQFGNAAHNPTAVHSLQGFTSADRMVMLGCQDGYIRTVDPGALDDDGAGINSYCFFGPILDKQGTLMVLADLQGDVSIAATTAALTNTLAFKVYGAQDANYALTAAQPNTLGVFLTGRNRSQPIQVAGHALYVQLQNNSYAQLSWGLEKLTGRIRVSEGKGRQRLF